MIRKEDHVAAVRLLLCLAKHVVQSNPRTVVAHEGQ